MNSKATLRKESKGVMEMPFKLMVMVLLIATVVPVCMISYRNVRRAELDNHLREELNKIIRLATVISKEGNLSCQDIEFDISGNVVAGVSHVRFGDDVGGDTNIIEYRMSWRKHTEFLHLKEDIHLSSPRNSWFMLRSGTYRLSLTNLHISEEASVVIVSRAGQQIDYDSFYH